MTDLIDRQAALDAMDSWDKFGCDPDGKLVRYDDDNHYVPYVHYDDMVHAIKHLPSAQPERKKGKWIYNSPVTMKCNQCGFVIKDWDWHRFKYCPNCIADMRGESDG